jgi:hypothetical protein
MEKEKYRFDESRHLHQLLVDGEYRNLTGCTTVLSVVAKPALIQWAANMTAEYIRENAKREPIAVLDNEKEVLGDYIVNDALLEEARKAHAKRKTQAGGYGTETHKIISEIIKDVIENSGGYILSGRNSNKSVNNFIEWAIKNKVKFLETEKNIYSESLFLGGIVDFVCEIDGQIWIGDVKTSGSGIYVEHMWQCAGYHIMMKEMKMPFAEDVKGYLILNLKESGEMLEKRSVSNNDNTEAFLSCLKIYRIQEKIKNLII